MCRDAQFVKQWTNWYRRDKVFEKVYASGLGFSMDFYMDLLENEEETQKRSQITFTISAWRLKGKKPSCHQSKVVDKMSMLISKN